MRGAGEGEGGGEGRGAVAGGGGATTEQKEGGDERGGKLQLNKSTVDRSPPDEAQLRQRLLDARRQASGSIRKPLDHGDIFVQGK